MVLLLLGCTKLPDWDDVRSACGLSGSDTAPLAWSRVQVTADPEPLEAGCVEALGDAFLVDWDSFGTTPEVARIPENPESALFGGLFAIVAADLGTVGNLRGAADDGELVLVDEIAGEVMRRLGDDAPAGRFYAEYVWSVTTEISLGQEDGCSFSTYGYGVIHVCPSWYLDDQLDYIGASYAHTNAAAAAAFVHESFHQSPDAAPHEEEPCDHDADPYGAYGANARWLALWEAGADDRATQDDLDVASSIRNGSCARIENYEGWAPCEGASEGLCNGEASVTPMR